VALSLVSTPSQTGRGEAEQFLYATSHGAAEFAKRRQKGMARCLLPEECRGRRQVHETKKGPKDL
jgi:hypothetical protein